MIKAASQRLDYDDRRCERKRDREKSQDQDHPAPTVPEVQRVPDTVPLRYEQFWILPIDVKNSPFPKLIRVHEARNRLLPELPGIRCAAADPPARHHDIRIVRILVLHFARQPDRDIRLVIREYAGDTCHRAVRFLAVVELDYPNHIRHSPNERPQDRLLDNDITVQHALALGLEPSNIHRSAFGARWKRRRKPFMSAQLALPHQVLMLLGPFPPFARIEI